jgi:hypothetical protein
LFPVKQTLVAERNYVMRIGYPLSESVAPPGTAWGAEGQRGNEANENNLMVLALARARKGQSTALFAQQDMAVRFLRQAPGFASLGLAFRHPAPSRLSGPKQRDILDCWLFS